MEIDEATQKMIRTNLTVLMQAERTKTELEITSKKDKESWEAANQRLLDMQAKAQEASPIIYIPQIRRGLFGEFLGVW